MEQVIMKNGVNHVIDNIEKVEERMSRIGINASVEQIKKNVREDDIFYFTDMLEPKIPSDRSVFFSWINTGFSYSNEPVFVSLVRNQDEFCGHFVGTPSFLVEGMKKTFEYKPRETKELYQNLQKLKKRYMSKNVNDVENAVLVYSDDNNNAVEEELERKNTEVEWIQVPKELTTVTEEIFHNLSYPNWNSINGLDRYIKIIGKRVEQLIAQEKSEYFVMNKIRSVVVNTGLMDKFGKDYLVLYRYNEKYKAYVAYQIMYAKTDYVNNDFTKEQASVKIKPISFVDDRTIHLEASIEDFDINHRCLSHIIEERRERFPISLQEESADKIAEKILVCLERGLKIQQRDTSYAKLTYSGESGKLAWLLPLHIHNGFTQAPELVMVIKKVDDFYEVKTILPYDAEIQDRITSLALYRGLW